MAHRGRYILELTDRSKLRNVFSWRLRGWVTVLCVIVLCSALVALGWLIGWRRAGGGAGRLAADSREEVIDMLMKLDSLKTVVDLNRAYIDNLSNVLDRNRIPTDSIDMGKPVAPLPPESLMDAGDAERNFVANISSQNNYRTSALASLAADGVTFHPLTMAGIQTQSSMESREAVIFVPGSDPVLAPADGRVIDIYYSSLNGYSVMLQHPRGFVSRIRGLGRILVNEGDYLSVGDAVGMGPGQKRRHSSITLRLWHNGTPLLPADYIRQPNQKLNSK